MVDDHICAEFIRDIQLSVQIIKIFGVIRATYKFDSHSIFFLG